MGVDHLVDVAAFGGHIGVREVVVVLVDQLGAARGRVLGVSQFLAVQQIHRTLGAHDGDLGSGPGQIHVGTQRLGAHHAVGAAICLAGDHRDQWDGGFGVGVDDLGAAVDDAIPLLVGAGQEAGHVDEGQHRNVEGVAGTHETGGLFCGIDVDGAGQHHRLVRHNADGAALDASEAADHVLGVQAVDLQEVVIIEYPLDDLVHVVGLVGAIGNDRVECQVVLGDGEVGLFLFVDRRILEVVLGQEGDELAHILQGILLIGGQIVRVAGLGGVGTPTTEFLHGHVLTGDGLDDRRSGDEHL